MKYICEFDGECVFMSIFDRIQELARKRDKSLQEVATDLEFSKNLFYRWKTSEPKANDIKKVADYFNVSTDYLLGHTTKENEVDEQFMQFFRTETNELTTEEKSEMVEDVREFLEFRKAQLLKRKGK